MVLEVNHRLFVWVITLIIIILEVLGMNEGKIIIIIGITSEIDTRIVVIVIVAVVWMIIITIKNFFNEELVNTTIITVAIVVVVGIVVARIAIGVVITVAIVVGIAIMVNVSVLNGSMARGTIVIVGGICIGWGNKAVVASVGVVSITIGVETKNV